MRESRSKKYPRPCLHNVYVYDIATKCVSEVMIRILNFAEGIPAQSKNTFFIYLFMINYLFIYSFFYLIALYHISACRKLGIVRHVK